MYYQYFGLSEPPFSIAVDPRYLFMSPRHRDALAHLLYGVGSGGGFILLTGEVGTGKTTINRCLLEQLPQDTDIAIILNPALNAQELLASVCDELGLGYEGEQPTLKTLTDKLHAFLLQNHARGRKTVLMIDEAQHLDFDVLEQIRLLTNLETNSEKLLQIILIGQPELAQMLARPELRQLNQRITARYNLEPLNLDETGAYIHHRLQVAGMSPERVIFPRSVVRGIHRVTRGIPRVINVLCDRILLGAYGRNKTRADKAMLRLAVREVLGRELRPSPWSRIAVATALVLAIAGVAWYIAGMERGQPAATPPLAVTPPSGMRASNAGVESAAGVERAALTAPPLAVEPVAVPDSTPEASLALVSGTAAETVPEVVSGQPGAQAQPAVAAAPEAGPELSRVPAPSGGVLAAAMLQPGLATELLWQLNGVDAPSADCPKTAVDGVACVEGKAPTWDELTGLDRPLVLEMVTPERFAAQVLLLGMDGTNAWVYAGGKVELLPLSLLAPHWTGSYAFLWHPPEGFSRPLSQGDRGPAVAEVAALFARLDGMEEPLAAEQFNPVLEQRVRIFQSRHKLDDDGVVGMRTLLKLNEQLGIDPSARDAREQLSSDTTRGQGGG